MIKDFGKEMKDYIKDIENILETDEQRIYFLRRTSQFFDVVQAQIEEIVHLNDTQISNIEKKQAENSQRLDEMAQKIKDIHDELYDEYEEFEIICPYCNYEFDAEVDENTLEVTCPECSNIIELDWNGDPSLDVINNEEQDSECGGNCSGCNECKDAKNDDDVDI